MAYLHDGVTDQINLKGEKKEIHEHYYRITYNNIQTVLRILLRPRGYVSIDMKAFRMSGKCFQRTLSGSIPHKKNTHKNT